MYFGFSHMVIGLFMQLILGSVVESVLGPWRLAILYIVVIIGSNIFGAVCSSDYTVGSDPIVFSLIGCLFSMLAFYWHRLGEGWKIKLCTVISLVTILVVAIMIMVSTGTQYKKYSATYNFDYPDTFGIIGGFIFGVSVSFALLPTDKVKTKAETAMFIVGCVVTPALMVTLFTVFWAVVVSKTNWWIKDKTQ